MRVRDRAQGFDEVAALSGETGAYRLARSTNEALAVARSIATGLGSYAPIIDRYLAALSYAPATHLALLRRRRARIVFAPTIDAALTSRWADSRRNEPLTIQEVRQIRLDYGPESGAVAVYDPVTDALVLPTAYCCTDLKRVVLHELGHALTIARAQILKSLIQDLPYPLHRHVYAGHYVAATAQDTLRQRVLEALAEGYTYVVDGRLDELPAPLASELLFMLQTVEDGQTIRFEFDKTLRLEFETTPAGERTASRGSAREIVDETHAEYGQLFVGIRLDPNAEAWNLVDDELVTRRRDRDIAS